MLSGVIVLPVTVKVVSEQNLRLAEIETKLVTIEASVNNHMESMSRLDRRIKAIEKEQRLLEGNYQDVTVLFDELDKLDKDISKLWLVLDEVMGRVK